MSARTYDGPALLSYSFRPFFLLGSVYAGLSILVWLPVFKGELRLVSAFMPRDWHVHEMLFGFLPAVITGFLFTAIPNWTGRLPLRGRPLMFLVALWILGRACVTFSAQTGWLAALLVDCSFILLVAAAAAREIIAGKKWNNLSLVLLTLVLLAANAAFHLEAHFKGAAEISIRVGIPTTPWSPAKARFAADDAKVTRWAEEHPEPRGKRPRLRWSRRWCKYRDEVCMDSWHAQIEAESQFRKAQWAIAKIHPADRHELALMAAAAAIYDKTYCGDGFGQSGIISYGVVLGYFRLSHAGEVA